MPPKVLLTFAPSEGGFAAQVARRLERARIPNERHSVRSAKGDVAELGERTSDLLVVLLSQESLASHWSASPLERTESPRWQGPGRDLVVLAVDSLETLGNLPYWLRRGVVAHAKTPAQAFNEISSHFAALELGGPVNSLFVGREQDVVQLAAKVAPPFGTEPPAVAIVHGLDGIGRRTLLGHVLTSYLALAPGPYLELRPTDSLDWLHVLLVQEARELESQADLAAVTATFQTLTKQERIAELVRLLGELSLGRRTPVIIDSGALLDEAGALKPETRLLIDAIQRAGTLRLGIVMNRAPRGETSVPLAVHRLGPLTREATRLLMTQEFREADIVAEQAQISRLATWAAGYPPAVRLLVAATQRFGLKEVLADDHALRDLTLRLFVPLVDRLAISRDGWQVLRVLGPFGYLPTDVVAQVAGLEPDQLQSILAELTERNVIVATGTLVGISPPLRHAIEQRSGEVDEGTFTSVAAALRERYFDGSRRESLIPIEVVEALTIAVARAEPDASLSNEFGAYEVPSTLVRLAHEAYIARHWGRALQYAERAVVADPHREDALVIQLKAHVRLGHWLLAEHVLERIERHGGRARHYLRGFIHWKRNEWAQATEDFEAAIQSGDRSTAVRRDLATCLFNLGRFDEARRELEQIDERAASSNRFILDLMANVAIRLGNLDAAESYIDQLLRHGFRAEYLHRLAHLRLEQGKPQDALAAAEQAQRLAPHRRESTWLRAEALALMGRHEQAASLVRELPTVTELDSELKKAMLAILSLATSADWRAAAEVWNTLASRDNGTVMRLRAAILDAALRDESIPESERADLYAERMGLISAGRDLERLPPDFAAAVEV